jgi:hypothetical protein
MLELLSLTGHNERATNAAFLFYPKKTTDFQSFLFRCLTINPCAKADTYKTRKSKSSTIEIDLNEVADLVAHIPTRSTTHSLVSWARPIVSLREELSDRARKRV